MKLTILLTSNDAEKNWNAFRLANFSADKDDIVTVFLIGAGVEYIKYSSQTFNISKQVSLFLKKKETKILGCQTCMIMRKQKETKTAPIGGIKELYELIAQSDKVVTF